MSATDIALNLIIRARDFASETLTNLGIGVQQTGEHAAALDESLDNAGQQTGHFSDQLEGAESSTAQLGNELDHTADQADALNNSLDNADQQTGDFADQLEGAEDSTAQLGNELEHTASQTDGLAGGISALIKKLKVFLISVASFIGLNSLFSGAIQSSISFEKQLDRVQAVTNATADEMQELESAAEQAGSTTQFTATEAAKGLEILARSGYTAGESIKLLPTLLNVAIAEGIELGEAAQILSDTLSIMGKEAEYGAEAADILAKGSSLSATTISQLGLAVSYAGAYTKDFNLDLADLTALLDVMAKNGLRGERAGVALRSILAQLSDPSSKATQELDKLGISTANLSEMLDGLVAAGDNGKEAVLAFGVEAGPGLKALLAEGSEGIEAFKQQLQDASGAAQTMADIASDNLDGSILGVGSAWDALRRKLTDPLLQPLADLADELADKFRELGPAFSAFGQVILAVLPRIQGTFKVVYNTFTLAAKSIGVFTSQIISWAADTELALARVLNKVGLVSDQTVKALELQAGGVRAVLDAMKEEAEQDITDIGDGVSLMWDGWTDGAKKAADQQKEVREQTEKTAQAGEAAQQKVKDSADQTTQSIRNQTLAIKQQDEAWNTLGLDAAEAVGGITQKGAEVIGAFSTIALSANATGQQITAAFTGAISKAKTQGEAEALIAILEEMGERGKVSASELETALAGVSDTLKALAGDADSAWSALGLEMEAVTGQITEQGQAAVDAFRDIAFQGDLTADQIHVVFNAALGKTRTRAEVEALVDALEHARAKGKITGDAFSDAFKRGREALKKFDKKVSDTEEGLDSAGDTGRKAMDSIGDAASGASDSVGELADETARLNRETEKADDQTRSGGSSRIGARQYYDLTKSGNNEAAARFQELADAYGNTMEGLVLGPKGAAAMEAELDKLRQQAIQQTQTPAQAPASSPTPVSATPTRTVRIEFAAQGAPSITGDFDESNADQLIRMLSDAGRVAG